MIKKNKLSFEQIVELYPFLFAETLYIDCNQGWLSILNETCEEITLLIQERKLNFIPLIEEIKEKYGTMRVYYTVCNIYPCKDEYKENNWEDLPEEIHALIQKLELKSAVVCEWCSKAGKLRNNHVWIKTLCDDCSINRTTSIGAGVKKKYMGPK